MLNEADTRAKLIDPKLHSGGWAEEKIVRDKFITWGKLIDEKGKRSPGKKPDYILLYNPSFPLAVVEAKEEAKSALEGMQQAKEYAEMLGVSFAYSSNGHQIEEFDFIVNKQRSLGKFPSPEELFKRYWNHKFVKEKIKSDPLLYPFHKFPGGKEPWYFQVSAIQKVIEAILKGRRRILLNMASGTGKTFVAFQIVWKLLESKYFRRVLYLADRNFLRDQAYNEFGPFKDARAVIEEGKAPKNRDVYFSIYQAMYSGDEEKRSYQQYSPDFFDLIIIDECHRSGYGTWKEILDYFKNAVHLGMTATPKQTDNIDTYAYFGEPIFSYSMGKAIEDGFLAPFHIYRNFTNIDREGLHIQEAIYQGAQIFIPEEADLKEIYTLEDFEREITIPDRTSKICEHLAKLLETFGPLQKTIVFCVNMEHAALVCKELQNHFSHLGYSDYAVRIVSEEMSAKEIYEKFRDSEKTTPVIATTVDLLTTGVDIPSVRNLVFLKPLGSKVYFKQHIGRGCRIDPITNKYFFRIIDYVKAVRLLDEWDYPGGAEPQKIVEGPFDISIEGLVISHQDQKPIDNARIVAQLGPNMQRIAKTNEQGKFVLSQLPHSPITLHITKQGFRSREKTITPSPELSPILIELKLEKPPAEKITIKGIEVHIAEETKIFLTADGKTLTDAEYIEYSKEGVVKRALTLKQLYQIWLNAEQRQKFLQDLEKESINPESLALLLKRPDADHFDILAHITFNAPIFSRDERANGFINKKADFIQALGPKSQEVILALLDKYRLAGIEELSRPEVFEIPPFDKFGYIRGVAEIFGSLDNLKNAIQQLEHGLYGEVGGFK